MSLGSPFSSPLSPARFRRNEAADANGRATGQEDTANTGRRVLSNRETEELGMWAATLKVMAGTQHLLPTLPTFVPVVLPQPGRHHYPRSFPFSSHPSAPPGTPSGHNAPERTTSTRGILQEAAAACQNLIRVAQTLDRRTNAERRIAQKRSNRSSKGTVGRAAPASTPPAVGDNSRCRAATPRPPRPSPHVPLDLVGLVTTLPPSSSLPPPPPLLAPLSSPQPLGRTFTDAGVETVPGPIHCDIGVDASSPSSVSLDAVVRSTTYGDIEDPFARALARLLPWNQMREQQLARCIWLDEWEANIGVLERLPPFLRVYHHILYMLFRPGAHPARRAAIPPGFAPVCNLFTHWWCAWNALTTAYGPPEPDLHRRYYPLTPAQIRAEAPLEGRGYILEHASWFS
ncbi:hypothetical protein C8R43DRAFT_976020 [Mycena crocata]|nr:hypothetical protein C8R43DRAFT_976020 [Mycena crocata]